MIITMTLNPSLDRTLVVDRLARGAILRTSEPTLEPGGKGVNVTRALALNGIPSIAILPLGGREGTELHSMLAEAGVNTRALAVSGRTRSNITIAEHDGTVTKLNEPGSQLHDHEVRALADLVASNVSAGDWIVMSGSVPPGFTSEQMKMFAAGLSAHDVHLAIDTSGDALIAGIEARPRLIKPNRAELAEISGRALECLSDVVDAATAVRDRGVEMVLVSLGADGAVLVGPDGVVVGTSRVEHPRSTVGAGDSFLAGFLSKFSVDETDVDAAMLEALAWGAAAASLAGTSVPGQSDIDFTHVRLVWQPDLDRPLLAS
ncbi:1-phosphofructokinase [Salinibacterium sp. G-O1]|uniref:1-phosphofructokinase n=1 Tax=Salinibacterium sp. G-O1 TaxID=3046208 RepID=UPI0024B8CF2C|nr:1-phosphofructokinase [Salinibacterium sp. G-O1]MDJ0335150.1 1-phosphofructokinase [Salinibacterium sp. G-O1]